MHRGKKVWMTCSTWAAALMLSMSSKVFLPRWCFILTRKLWACRLLRTFLQCMQRTEETQVPAFKLAAGRPEAMSDELSSTTRWFWRFEPSESPGIRAQVAKLCTWNPTKAQDLQWITDASFHEAEAAGRRPGMVGPKDACRSNHAWPASQECCTALPAGPQSQRRARKPTLWDGVVCQKTIRLATLFNAVRKDIRP